MSIWRSLRVRLTAAFLLLAACSLAATGEAIVRFVRQATLGTIDTTILEEATTLAGLTTLPHDRLSQTVHDIGRERDVTGRKFIRIEDADRRRLAAWRRMPSVVDQSRPTTLKDARVITVGHRRAIYQVAWAPTPTGGLVAIGAHARREVGVIRRARWAVSLVALLLLAILGAGAWTITGRATRELDRLAAEVATIEAGSLARRLTTRSTEEVDRLVAVLNRVLGRLERSVGQLQRFTADAAHELRTPLATIRARLEVALYRDTPTVPREVVADALEQTDRLRRLAEDLLMLARVEGGAVRAETLDARVDLSRVVEEVGCAMAPIAEEHARPFAWTAAPGLVVRGSEPLLKRVLLNLVDNAFRHTPASAAVAIDARRLGREAVVEVTDKGPGIDPGVVPHLFERFHHGVGGGTGLGLALVREIVERHHGCVSLAPDAAGGTGARVALPLAGAPAAG